jgi:hypothetical protein
VTSRLFHSIVLCGAAGGDHELVIPQHQGLPHRLEATLHVLGHCALKRAREAQWT